MVSISLFPKTIPVIWLMLVLYSKSTFLVLEKILDYKMQELKNDLISLVVDLEDLSVSEHGDVDVVFEVSCKSSWEDFLHLSVAGEVDEDLLVGCKVKFEVRF